MSPLVTFTIIGFHFLSFRFVPSYELITICDICRHKVNFFIFIVLSVSKYSRFLVFKLRRVSAISYAASQSRHGISCTSRWYLHWGGGCFGGWKQHQTMLTQILVGLHSDAVGFSGQILVIPPKKRSSPKFSRFFRPISGDLKKKGLQPGSPRNNPVFWFKSHQVHIANPSGGSYFHFSSKNRPQKL